MKIIFFISIGCLTFFSSTAQVILKEEFNDNKNSWKTTTDSSKAIVELRDGKYIIDQKKDATVNGISVSVEDKYDYSIKLDAKRISGKDSLSYGLVFGANEKFKSGYTFYIDLTGYYTVQSIYSGKTTPLIEWTYTDVIKKENNTVNTLRVTKTGLLWNIFINDKLVKSINAMAFADPSKNYLGVVVVGNQQIEFDNLIMEKLKSIE